MRRFRFIPILALLISSFAIARVLAQLNESPPQVVSVSPTDEVALDSSITVMFNEIMNPESVQAAWSIEPPVEGAFTWKNPYTLIFTPNTPLQRETDYVISVANTAASSANVTLADPYTKTIKTVRNLKVTSVQPAPDTTEVLGDAVITVAFSQPVVPLMSVEDMGQLPNPLVIEPAIRGKGTWLNSFIYEFVPDPAWNGSTTYTVTVKAGLTDISGAPLVADYSWSFTTILPQIVDVYPYSGASYVGLDEPVQVSFSQPMDHAATEAALRVLHNDQPVAGAFTWSDDGMEATFKPQDRYEIGGEYRVIVDKTVAKSISGAPLSEGSDTYFYAIPLPSVSSIYPDDDYIVYPGVQTVSISFATEMDQESLKDAVTIAPMPDDTTPQIWSSGVSYTFEFLPLTTYTITVKGGTKDIYGNTLSADVTESFTVEDIPAMQSEAKSALWERLLVTGAYRKDTSVAVRVAGTPTMNLSLYRVTPENIWRVFSPYYYSDDNFNLAAHSEPVRSWTETFTPQTDYAYMRLKLAGEQGGALTPGVYLLQGLAYDYNYEYPTIVAVTNANVTVKRISGQMWVWVTDMQTGAPLADQAIVIYDGEVSVGQGVTDADGLLRLDVQNATWSSWLTVIAQKDDHYGVWRSYTPSTMPSNDVYIYTDRPIYRPGETLYYRGTYRQRNDVSYLVNNQTPLQITITDPRGEMLVQKEVELNDFGSFSGEIQLSDTLPTGQIYIQIMELGDDQQNWTAYAQVAEYRVPEYKVAVTAEQTEFASGGDLRALVNTTYFSGGAVSNATINWTATSSRTGFNYKGRERYSFVDWWSYDYYADTYTLASEQASTQADGSFMIDIPDVKTQSIYPETVMIEASISDESGQSIAGRTSVLLHGTDTYIGVRTDKYFGEEDKPFNAEVIAVSPQSDPIANEAITLKLVMRDWRYDEEDGWGYEDVVVDSTTVTTDQEGKASHTFTPPDPGSYTVQASTTDYHSSAQIYVSGNSRYVYWGESQANTVTLLPDKDSYVAGDIAEIFMQLPFEGTSWALIDVERNGIIQHEVVKIEGSNLLYKLPITEAHEPGIFFSVMLVHGLDDTYTTPVFAQQTIKLAVEPLSKRLNITLKPSTTNAKPGDVVTVDISVTDATGKPVKAEFGLMMVDAAILSLTGPNSAAPEAHYYGGVSNWTTTDTMLSEVHDQEQDELFGGESINEMMIDVTPTPIPAQYAPGHDQTVPTNDPVLLLPSATAAATTSGQFGAGAARESNELALDAAAPMAEEDGLVDGDNERQQPVDVRSDFQQTPLWAAHVITDDNGVAQVSVTMPDNLTIWNLTARATTLDTKIGEVKLDIASTLPLLVRPVAPRFFVVGDEVTLGMVINNNSDEPQDIKATLQGTGFTFIDTTADQQTLVEPHARVRVDWRVKILDVEAVDLTYIALGNNGFQDASKPPLSDDGKIPVYRYTAPEVVGTAGVLRDAGSRTEGIIVPEIADTDQGELTIKIDHSLAAATLDSLTYLKNYPHQCIEQTVSRFLPNLITMRALQKLNVDMPQLESNLDSAMDYGLNRLINSQNYDGGWGWFPTQYSNPYVSAYALLGLVEARDSGYNVPESTLNNAVLYIRQQLIYPTLETEGWELNRQSFYFYVLARVSPSNVTLGEMSLVFDYRVEMSYAARAYLLMSYAVMGNANDQIQALSSDLLSNAHLSATGAHWEEAWVDYWNWGSDVRTTAVVLTALLKVDPTNEILPNAVRWLMIARDGDHWASTQETTWSVMALTDWMVATQELEANYTYTVSVNDELESTGVVVPDNVREGETLSIAVQDLLVNDLNRLTITHDEGQGALYYTAHLKLALDASKVGPLNRGVAVSREYLINDQPVTEVKVGDVVTVRLTMTLPETMYYVVAESPIPAGTEIVDKSLLTTAQAGDGSGTTYTPGYEDDYGGYYGGYYGMYDSRWWWGWWSWTHKDVRDESLNLYADVLYPGTYVYSYEVRASVAGAFQVMPAQVSQFYFPEVFGRSAGELFTVK